MPDTTLNLRLDDLFARWEAAAGARSDFHRDGIVDEAVFQAQRHKLLFVMLEPSSRGPGYEHLLGCDLRDLYRTAPPLKELTKNVALWTLAILDGCSIYFRATRDDVQRQLRRVAIVNLKKISGTGDADHEAIAAAAWRDRSLLREQIGIIGPEVLVACGDRSHRLLGKVLTDAESHRAPSDECWEWRSIKLVLANHPSLRPAGAPAAMARLVDRCRTSGVGVWGGRPS